MTIYKSKRFLLGALVKKALWAVAINFKDSEVKIYFHMKRIFLILIKSTREAAVEHFSAVAVRLYSALAIWAIFDVVKRRNGMTIQNYCNMKHI